MNIRNPTPANVIDKDQIDQLLSRPDITNYLEKQPSNLSTISDEKSSHPFEINRPFINPTSMIAKRQGSAFKAIIKPKSTKLSKIATNNPSFTMSMPLYYEILVNSVLKIFHHPGISLMPLKSRLHLAMTQWPLIWVLQLGRRSMQNDTDIILEKLTDPQKKHHLSPTMISSFIYLVNSLKNLSLDQAEYGLIETILIAKSGSKGMSEISRIRGT